MRYLYHEHNKTKKIVTKILYTGLNSKKRTSYLILITHKTLFFQCILTNQRALCFIHVGLGNTMNECEIQTIQKQLWCTGIYVICLNNDIYQMDKKACHNPAQIYTEGTK